MILPQTSCNINRRHLLNTLRQLFDCCILIYLFCDRKRRPHNFIYSNFQGCIQHQFLMNSTGKAYSKLKWTPQEQQLLRSLKEEKYIDSWKIIANQMNKIFVEKNRSGKQCRERYMNYVRFGKQIPKVSRWTQEEDEELFLKFMQHGAKWVQIGKQMPGRSENCLKNRFYGAMRKIIRKINKASKQKKMRHKKPIKSDLLIRILQHEAITSQQDLQHNIQTHQFFTSLKKEMIKIAINPEENATSQQIQSLISGIMKFCSVTKAVGCKRSPTKIKQLEQMVEGIVESQEIDEIDEGQNSYMKSLEQNELEEARTLVENKPVKQKFKIKQNIILFSSQDLNAGKPINTMGFQLFNRAFSAEFDLPNHQFQNET